MDDYVNLETNNFSSSIKSGTVEKLNSQTPTKQKYADQGIKIGFSLSHSHVLLGELSGQSYSDINCFYSVGKFILCACWELPGFCSVDKAFYRQGEDSALIPGFEHFSLR